MASSSRNPVKEALEEYYEEFYEQPYEAAFESLCIDYEEERQPTKKKKKKRVYIYRDHPKAHEGLWNDYFSDTPKYVDYMFRRRFRMNKPLFLYIVHRLSSELPYFQLQKDATGKIGLSGLQKCTAAIRILAYGGAADSYDEYLQIAESTALQCMHNFVDGIIAVFGDEFLRKPTSEDVERLLQIGDSRGFPGMIGSIDCMHWEWKNCPTEWSGQYARGHKKPTIVLEVVASHDLWIWHTFFGSPGTFNDLNILDRSSVFKALLNGKAPKVKYWVNGSEYKMAYYLVDGIYPQWATFVQSISLPQSPKHKNFSAYQEAVRKDVERAFGVLQSRFAIVKHPARTMKNVCVGKVMKACIILHNMIVQDERGTYGLCDTSEFELREGAAASKVDLTYSTTMPTNKDLANIRVQVRDRKKHHKLKDDLVEHLWKHEQYMAAQRQNSLYNG